MVYKKPKEHGTTWEKLEDKGISMKYDTVMHPHVLGEMLEKIYINMDNTDLKNYKSKFKSSEQYELADKRYITSVYFHTLFLYTISTKKNYTFKRHENNNEFDVEITDYLKDLFENYYSNFLLNFQMDELMNSLGDI